MVMHAVEHHNRGFPLPTHWMAVRDTFANHQETTHKTLLEPFWDGRWSLSQGGHVATYHLNGVAFVRMSMIGFDSPSDAERLRTACHGIWFDEAAPAMALSTGLSQDAWALALSSQRMPTHARPAVVTTNYPDEEHWTWRRFVTEADPERLAVRIPPGERAGAEYRAELVRAYRDRPDLLRRLVEGKPGVLLLGEQVAPEFDRDAHVSPMRLLPDRSAPLWFGHDGGHTPVTIIGQRTDKIRILAALASEHGGTRQHMLNLVLPWVAQYAPWLLEAEGRQAVYARYDPSMDKGAEGDIDVNAVRMLEQMLPGHYQPGPVDWTSRLLPLQTALNGRQLLLDPEMCVGLIRALNGGWHYPTGMDGKVTRDLPKKPNHPHEDYGDALCYLLAGLAPSRPLHPPRPRQPAILGFSPYTFDRPRPKSKTTFSVWR